MAGRNMVDYEDSFEVTLDLLSKPTSVIHSRLGGDEIMRNRRLIVGVVQGIESGLENGLARMRFLQRYQCDMLEARRFESNIV